MHFVDCTSPLGMTADHRPVDVYSTKLFFKPNTICAADNRRLDDWVPFERVLLASEVHPLIELFLLTATRAMMMPWCKYLYWSSFFGVVLSAFVFVACVLFSFQIGDRVITRPSVKDKDGHDSHHGNDDPAAALEREHEEITRVKVTQQNPRAYVLCV